MADLKMHGKVSTAGCEGSIELKDVESHAAVAVAVAIVAIGCVIAKGIGFGVKLLQNQLQPH